MTIEQVARVCHEMNKAVCESAGDFSQVNWENASDNIKASAIDGVKKALANPNMNPGDSHRTWAEFKKADGYVYGPVKDDVAKTHPSLVPFGSLSQIEQTKDFVFVQTVNSLRNFIEPFHN